MFHSRRTFALLAGILLWTACATAGFSQVDQASQRRGRNRTEAPPQDTARTRQDTARRQLLREVQSGQQLTPEDSARLRADSLRRASDAAYLDSLRRNSSFTSRIDFTAEDSIGIDLRARDMRLYQDAKLDFENKKLESARMTVDYATGTIKARGIPDTTAGREGELLGMPVFTEGSQQYTTEEITYNFVTKRGVIVYTRTEQGENILESAKIRREPEGFFYAAGNRFTTCNNPSHPHYYIRSNRIKYIPNDKIVSGPFYMVVGDIPLPVVLPFGYFPNRVGRNSGILFPVFGEDANRGFNLRNGGYYLAPGDHWDLVLRGDIYANLSYRLEVASRYLWRYGAQGQASLQYNRNNTGYRGDPDFVAAQDFRILWQHQQAFTPNARFNASVNAGTSGFLVRATPSLQDVVTNTLASSISYSQTLPVSGWSFTANINHDQNTQTQVVNLTLPSLAITRTQPFFPFRFGSADDRLPRWYETIALSYQAQVENRVTVSERNFFKQAMLDSFQTGIRQSTGVSTNFKVLNYINLSPSVNYTEYWTLEPTQFEYFQVPLGALDLAEQRRRVFGRDTVSVVTDTVSGLRYGVIRRPEDGFLAGRDFSLNLSANTRIFGVYTTRWKNQAAFRHTINPTLSFSYRPDFSDPRWGFYQTVQQNPADRIGTRRSRFERSPIGGPGGGRNSLLSFRLQNLVEMRYLPRDTSGRRQVVSKKDFKYVNLLDDASIGFSYNLAADSFPLSDIAISARTSLFEGKLAINYNATIEPYVLQRGREVERLILQNFRWNDPGTWSIGRLSNANVAISTQFSGGRKTTRGSGGGSAGTGPDRNEPGDLTPDTRVPGRIGGGAEISPIDQYRNEYVDFNVPWSVFVNYNFGYSNAYQTGSRTVQSLTFSGEAQLTTKWRFGMQSGWDFQRSALTLTSFSVMRDLHCWQFSFTAVPFGQYRSYDFQINVVAPSLQDLRLQKRRAWQDYFGTRRPIF